MLKFFRPVVPPMLVSLACTVVCLTLVNGLEKLNSERYQDTPKISGEPSRVHVITTQDEGYWEWVILRDDKTGKQYAVIRRKGYSGVATMALDRQ